MYAYIFFIHIDQYVYIYYIHINQDANACMHTQASAINVPTTALIIMLIHAPASSQQQLQALWIAVIAVAVMLPCALTLSSTRPFPPIHRVLIHSVQSIPAAAFPNAPAGRRSVPYRMVNSTAACAVELSFMTSAFDDALPMRVVPPHTGYPRASKFTDEEDCSVDFDVCAQPFQVTLPVKPPCTETALLYHFGSSRL